MHLYSSVFSSYLIYQILMIINIATNTLGSAYVSPPPPPPPPPQSLCQIIHGWKSYLGHMEIIPESSQMLHSTRDPYVGVSADESYLAHPAIIPGTPPVTPHLFVRLSMNGGVFGDPWIIPGCPPVTHCPPMSENPWMVE